MSGNSRRVRRCLSICAATGAAAAIAACGSSSSSSSSSANSGGSTTSAAAGTTTAAGGSSSPAATAKSLYSKYLAAPTRINQTVPLKRPAPRGKTFVVLQADVPSSVPSTQGAESALKAIGWKEKKINYQDADSSTLIAAMKQALQYHPVAVMFTGVPYQLWSSEVPAYKAAGVAIIPIDVGEKDVPISPTIPAQLGLENALAGKLMASYYIAKSDAKGKALVLDLPSFVALKQITASVNSTIKSQCPGCSTTQLDVTLQQQESNSINQAVVSALQRSPDTKYLLTAHGVLIPGLPAALKTAGISGITIIGGTATSENEQQMLNGTEEAFTDENYQYEGIAAVDVALRVAEGMSVQENDGGTPMQLLTKATVGTPSNSLPAPKDALGQFEKLWKVGQ